MRKNRARVIFICIRKFCSYRTCANVRHSDVTPAHMVEAPHACEAAATVRLVAVVVGLEGAGLGKTHVLCLIVAQLGQMRIKGR